MAKLIKQLRLATLKTYHFGEHVFTFSKYYANLLIVYSPIILETLTQWTTSLLHTATDFSYALLFKHSRLLLLIVFLVFSLRQYRYLQQILSLGLIKISYHYDLQRIEGLKILQALVLATFGDSSASKIEQEISGAREHMIAILGGTGTGKTHNSELASALYSVRESQKAALQEANAMKNVFFSFIIDTPSAHLETVHVLEFMLQTYNKILKEVNNDLAKKGYIGNCTLVLYLDEAHKLLRSLGLLYLEQWASMINKWQIHYSEVCHGTLKIVSCALSNNVQESAWAEQDSHGAAFRRVNLIKIDPPIPEVSSQVLFNAFVHFIKDDPLTAKWVKADEMFANWTTKPLQFDETYDSIFYFAMALPEWKTRHAVLYQPLSLAQKQYPLALTRKQLYQKYVARAQIEKNTEKLIDLLRLFYCNVSCSRTSSTGEYCIPTILRARINCHLGRSIPLETKFAMEPGDLFSCVGYLGKMISSKTKEFANCGERSLNTESRLMFFVSAITQGISSINLVMPSLFNGYMIQLACTSASDISPESLALIASLQQLFHDNFSLTNLQLLLSTNNWGNMCKELHTVKAQILGQSKQSIYKTLSKILDLIKQLSQQQQESIDYIPLLQALGFSVDEDTGFGEALELLIELNDPIPVAANPSSAPTLTISERKRSRTQEIYRQLEATLTCTKLSILQSQMQTIQNALHDLLRASQNKPTWIQVIIDAIKGAYQHIRGQSLNQTQVKLAFTLCQENMKAQSYLSNNTMENLVKWTVDWSTLTAPTTPIATPFSYAMLASTWCLADQSSNFFRTFLVQKQQAPEHIIADDKVQTLFLNCLRVDGEDDRLTQKPEFFRQVFMMSEKKQSEPPSYALCKTMESVAKITILYPGLSNLQIMTLRNGFNELQSLLRELEDYNENKQLILAELQTLSSQYTTDNMDAKLLQLEQMDQALSYIAGQAAALTRYKILKERCQRISQQMLDWATITTSSMTTVCPLVVASLTKTATDTQERSQTIAKTIRLLIPDKSGSGGDSDQELSTLISWILGAKWQEHWDQAQTEDQNILGLSSVILTYHLLAFLPSQWSTANEVQSARDAIEAIKTSGAHTQRKVLFATEKSDQTNELLG